MHLICGTSYHDDLVMRSNDLLYQIVQTKIYIHVYHFAYVNKENEPISGYYDLVPKIDQTFKLNTYRYEKKL